MIKNYLKIALRHILRNKSYVFINIIGLSVAIACCIIAFVNYQYLLKADSYHENVANIFRVTEDRVGSSNTNGDVKAPLMPNAVADISAIKEGVRFDNRRMIIQYGDNVFSERIWYADPNVLEVFTFPLKSGDKEAIKDPSKIFLSEKKAKKYFGDENPIGKSLTMYPGKSWQKDLIVGGVFENIPANSCFYFDFLTHISFEETGGNPDSLTLWKNQLSATFLVLNNPKDADLVAEKLSRYLPIQNAATDWNEGTKYRLEALNLVYKNWEELNNNRLGTGMISSFYWGPLIMALMILLTACLNFTNTTISFSNKRLKEMGVRKVMGGGRQQLVFQLLGESFIICLIALMLGVIIAEYLTPLYNGMWEYMNLKLSLDYLESPELLLFLGAIVLLTTFLGGAYPAFYISSFRPTQIFRGSTKFGGDTWLIKSLLGLQIVISLSTVIGGISFVQNAEFQKNYNFGYDVSGIININIGKENVYEQFKNIIAENPDIQGIAGSLNNLGFSNWSNSLGKPEDNRSVQVQLIGDGFLDVMGITLLEGRDFDKNRALDYEESCIINNKLMEEQQWASGLGKTIEMYDKQYNVIGVTEDIYQSGFFAKPRPSVFHFKKVKDYRVLKVKVAADKMIATNTYLKEKWSVAFPLFPFVSYYQDEVLADGLIVSQNISWMYLFLSIITILLSATGLFSLVSLNLLKRAKEIAIRRVVGASPENIAYIINKHYLIIFAVGGILGALGGIYFTEFLMDSIFKVNQGISSFSVILSVIGICLVGALTIGGKLIEVLRTNPAETLKSE